MTGENRITNARAEIAAAHDALKVADAALGLGAFRDAMSRAYYAAFHAARAMVLLCGVEPKTHSGLMHLLNEHLIRTGEIERRFNLVLTRLYAYREASDYAYSFELGGDDVSKEIAAARELLAVAERRVEDSSKKNV